VRSLTACGLSSSREKVNAGSWEFTGATKREVVIEASLIEQQIRPSRDILPGRKNSFREEFNLGSSQGGLAMSFGIYLVGYIILIAGLSIGANLVHVPMQWIGVGVLCLVGIAIVHGVTATRQKDPQS
jgi:hypothetical protein